MVGSAPAYADDGEHRSHALATLIDADALGLDVATVGTAEQNYVDNAGDDPVTGTVDVDALGGVLNLDVGGVSVPITLDGTNVGAASNYASTPLPSEATAASGTITGDGAIDVGGASGDFANVNLTAALSQLGVDTTGVIDAVELQLRAVASSVTEEAGTISSDYTLAGADLVIDSPAVGALTDDLTAVVAGLDETLDATLQDNILGEIPQTEIDVLGLLGVQISEPVLGVDVDLQSALAPVLEGELTGESGAVTIDLSTGQILVDVEQLYAGGTLNGLDPNTQVLSETELSAITTEVTNILSGLGATLDEVLTAALEDTSVTIELTGSVSLLGGLIAGDIADISIDTTLGDLLEGGVTSDDIEVTLLEGILSDVLGVIGVGAEELLNGLVAAVLDDIVGPLTDGLVTALPSLEELLGDGVQGVVDGLLAALGPTLDALPGLVSLTVNVQPTELGELGDLGETSFTVRAAELTVLPNAGAVALPLASSSVYAEDFAADPVVTVAPESVYAGETVSIDGTGYWPDSTVDVEILDADGNVVDTIEGVAVNADGIFTTDWTVPEGTEPAELTAVATDVDRPEVTAEAPFTVLEDQTGDRGD